MFLRIKYGKDHVNYNYYDLQPLFNESGKHLYDLLDYLKENNIDNVVFVNTPRFYEKRDVYKRQDRCIVRELFNITSHLLD